MRTSFHFIIALTGTMAIDANLATGARAAAPSSLSPLPSPASPSKVTRSSLPTSMPTPHSPAHTNRLAREKSPYLLQHQHNPVDWHAWGEEAFAKARAEKKPIFLSIGYSTCHWCHVMERESFEKEDTAAVLNAHFISIKVDREERPDVDKIYMTFVQAMTGSGGWPLNVFLTPDLKPFFGGTYWPPEKKFGRPSFKDVLLQVHQAWTNQHEKIAESATSLHGQLQELVAREADSTATLKTNDLHQAGASLKEGYDSKNGGFGKAPKFPTPSHPLYLLRYADRFQDAEATRMVLHTCDKMAAGGIYDQLGGGFSRYSVDERWLVPHFEKMLYDNAQLVQLYLDAHLAGDRPEFAAVVRDILRYILRDMTHPDGGFYSAEDADSEGKEGKFYCWTRTELQELLTTAEFKIAARYFGITQEGNFHDHSDPEALPHQNVLSIADDKLNPEERQLLASAKQKLFQRRAKRVRPHLDDKILASWNGLMLGAVARAYAVLGDDLYLKAAEKNLSFLQAKLWDPATKTLYHRWRDGERDRVQLQESYAFLLSGTLELYQATLDPRHLEFAIALAESMIERFYDRTDGGFWQSTSNVKDLILRVKEDYDGAEPSGNSVAILSLLKLGAITERTDFRAAADKSLALFAKRMKRQPQGLAFMLMAFDFAHEEPRRVVIAGDPGDRHTRSLLQAAHAVYQPGKVILGTAGPVEAFARTLKPHEGKPTAYVCTGTACKPPAQEPLAVKKWLK
ncbi:MAG: thioredoxin domain-containing protein [Verrucomicrobiales bacterium]|nr:thioredoxin domain-containing protein [Verrucomicrobiales bacterium]